MMETKNYFVTQIAKIILKQELYIQTGLSGTLMKSTAQLVSMTTILKTLQIILMSNSLQIYNNQSQVLINSLTVQVASDIIIITPIQLHIQQRENRKSARTESIQIQRVAIN
ncbi:Hypothetical_protein [Hexamita inflata]|uniref:Hypothetical_protein n=1 Tax=Hexamita inflata TaxID=28002 RepID=A0ABP1JFH1_9EUKA